MTGDNAKKQNTKKESCDVDNLTHKSDKSSHTDKMVKATGTYILQWQHSCFYTLYMHIRPILHYALIYSAFQNNILQRKVRPEADVQWAMAVPKNKMWLKHQITQTQILTIGKLILHAQDVMCGFAIIFIKM